MKRGTACELTEESQSSQGGTEKSGEFLLGSVPPGRTRLRSLAARGFCRLDVSDSFLAPSDVRPEANSEGEGSRVCSPHGITTDQHAVLPSLPRYDTAEHATEPIGLFPHL